MGHDMMFVSPFFDFTIGGPAVGFWDVLRRFFSGTRPGPPHQPNLSPPVKGKGSEELAERLGLSVQQLNAVPLLYDQFTIPKRCGGVRRIMAPNRQLKDLQRRILRRLLGRLRAHRAAIGFEKGLSIVTNASHHVGADVVVKMDLKDFFTSTKADRVRAYFYSIGWGQDATDILMRLCTDANGLPQGAPTSPRLSNLVNREMDARLDGYARSVGGRYTRYADDMTFSLSVAEWHSTRRAGYNPKTLPPIDDEDYPAQLATAAISMTKLVVADYGYTLHFKRKLNIRRRHQCQQVTGLVVNDKVALPRQTRRWLRAVEHHLEQARPTTITPQQLAGWQALRHMVDIQTQ
jgi:RNA-directed DNA polymerase